MRPCPRRLLSALLLTAVLASCAREEGAPLPGTRPLEESGDFAAMTIEAVDRLLDRETARSVGRRRERWSGPNALAANRRRLARILGVRDARVPFGEPELRATVSRSAVLARGRAFTALSVRWPVLPGVHGEGLLLVPDGTPRADIVALPDADQTPEEIAGLTGSVPVESQFARRLAEAGCRVLVPAVVGRETAEHRAPGYRRSVTLPHREYLYRATFELGRHPAGIEVQKVLAGVDWFAREAGAGEPRIGVIGYGEGGRLALFAAALDTRIDAACVSGTFGPREEVWREPIDRNVFGLLTRFGDAELAEAILPRALVVEAAGGPVREFGGKGAAPGRLAPPTRTAVEREVRRARTLAGERAKALVARLDPDGFCGEAARADFLSALAGNEVRTPPGPAPAVTGRIEDRASRQRRLVAEIEGFAGDLLARIAADRRDYLNIGLERFDRPDGGNRVETGDPEDYRDSVERFRRDFETEVIGALRVEPAPADPRSRLFRRTPEWTGYEVRLSAARDLPLYGLLLVPNDLRRGERRPVVVCAHGLEARPMDLVRGDHRYYRDYASRLAGRGYVVFAPQHLYVLGDRFRRLQRKANPLGLTLFSVMVAQHRRLVRWLGSLPFVDARRIAFYGLSYGGKSAMRIPALVPEYCLSICSGDFTDWVEKCASTRIGESYVFTGEYEMPEFDLGSRFNYAEMAALIAPRPFMVERGHRDGVSRDPPVASEFARVRFLYEARLGIPGRIAIEWFDGGHTIHGVGTFEFLDRHLQRPGR